MTDGKIEEALRKLMGAEHVSGEGPELRVCPGTEDEVAQVVRWRGENGTPLKLTRVENPRAPALITLDLKRLNRVLRVNQMNLIAEVQAGIGMEELERELNRRGFTLGHFLGGADGSTLGDWLATGNAGRLSAKYGNMQDLVMALSGVLPDGTRFHSKATPRSATGPDLDQLIIGSEGTLAVITAATLAVHPLPAWSAFRGYLCKDFAEGVTALRLLMREGLDPAAARLHDAADTKLHGKELGVDEAGCLLAIGFEGPDHALSRAKAEQGFALLSRHGKDLGPRPGADWLVSAHAERHTIQAAALWKNLLPLYSALTEALRMRAPVAGRLSRAYPTGAVLEFSLITEDRAPRSSDLEESVRAAGGTIISGLGIGSRPAQDIFRRFKERLDPNGILNPCSRD